MSCTSCSMGLPCPGEAMGGGDDGFSTGATTSSGGKSSFKLFGDPTKNRNTIGDILTGGLGAIGSAQARNAAPASGGSTVGIAGMQIPLPLAIAGAAVGVFVLVKVL